MTRCAQVRGPRSVRVRKTSDVVVDASPVGNRRQPLARWVRVGLMIAGLVGCSGDRAPNSDQVLSALGMVDAPRPEPEALYVLCDGSLDSTCERGEINEQIRLAATYLFARPGSRLEVHVLAARAAETVVVGRIEVPTRTERGTRAARSQQERFLATVQAQVCRPVEAELRQGHPRRSELAEALTRLGLSPTDGMRRRVIVMSDLREYSDVLDAECRPLPSRAEWLAKLRRRHLLPPGSFAGSAVHFARSVGGPVTGRGCSWTVARDLALRDLWRAAFEAAGATEITFSTDVVDPARLTPSTTRTTTTTDGGIR